MHIGCRLAADVLPQLTHQFRHRHPGAVNPRLQL